MTSEEDTKITRVWPKVQYIMLII